jgi:type II secretory pathway pseudopilin PulG
LVLVFAASLAAGSRAEEKPAPNDLDRQKATMAALRDVATSVETYAVDNKVYPGPTEGDVDVETLRAKLQPSYTKDLTAKDAWSHPLRYWSDGKHYVIVSNGRDGKADQPYDKVTAQTKISRFDGDIIFRDGMFVQWPEGPQH